jgi:hypothetical protein
LTVTVDNFVSVESSRFNTLQHLPPSDVLNLEYFLWVGVALSLAENVLRAEGQLFCFDNPKDLAIHA